MLLNEEEEEAGGQPTATHFSKTLCNAYLPMYMQDYTKHSSDLSDTSSMAFKSEESSPAATRNSPSSASGALRC
jgi:hypothetical protein